MKLVIVESPAKVKNIQKYLGKDYVVKSSKGHIADLPKSKLGVDVDNNYQPTYEVTKQQVLKELKGEVKKVDELILAVDPDREGESIGWHVAKELGLINDKGRSKPKQIPVTRITFTEITESAVKSAIQKPRELDMNLVNAQQARRVLDRLVGYKLSPLLWKKIRYGLSAGRVQSVAVKLIVDRERERDNFKPVEYWKIKGNFADKSVSKPEAIVRLKDGNQVDSEEEESEDTILNKEDFPFELIKLADKKLEASTEVEIKKVVDQLVAEKQGVITELETTAVNKQPPVPYKTSALQQDAVNKLGFAAKRTMQVAQKLYEAGFITYMRTDSITMSQDAINAARSFALKKYGKEYVPTIAREYKTKSKVAQEAHEAIRPTDFAKTSSSLKLTGDEARLYDLIHSRALASQMANAVMSQTRMQLQLGKALFQANGRKVDFPGYLKVYKEQVSEGEVPDFKLGQAVYLEKLLSTQHFTQPPARYSEATLVKELESLGIGRPSTYATIIQTIQSRKYVEKEGRYFYPTDTGIVVTDLLSKHFTEIVDVDFTARMEDDLDEVANGSQEWVKMIDEFYGPFSANIQKKDKEIDKEDVTVLGKSDEKCPECGKEMIIKLGKFGKFLSCVDFPNCKGMKSLADEGEPATDTESEEFRATYLPAPKTESGDDYVIKRGRFGMFWAHPDYPKVKDAKPLEMRPEKLAELYGEPPQTDDKRNYVLKKGRFGMFWAHPDYPAVKDIKKVKKN